MAGPPHKVAVVGINGVGKEYVREFLGLNCFVTLIDFGEVLHRETASGKLVNRFPGHEFEVDTTGKNVERLRVEDIDVAILERFNLVVFCTPPTYEGRSLLREGLEQPYRNYHVHVEKPWLWGVHNPFIPGNGYFDDDITVGYLYHRLVAAESAHIAAPQQSGWRDDFGIVWDMLGHVVSTCPYEYLPLLEVNHASMFTITISAPGLWQGSATYLTEESKFVVDGNKVDWNEHFAVQAQALMTPLATNRLCSVDKAVEIENALTRLAHEARLLSRR